MKFSEEKKQSIRLYILEKIQHQDTAIAKAVAENFGLNQTTVHAYLNELVNENAIRKVKRGQYELVSKRYEYELYRDKGELDSDTYALGTYLSKHIDSLSSNIQNIWSYAFSEMINNVMEHSFADKAKIIVEQDILTTGVWIFDDGIGIFQKIKDYFDLPSIEEAICELFKGKLTTDKENHSGEGIFFTSKLMDNFFIISGGKIFTNNKYDDSRIIDVASENLKGTCVMMELSNFSHKTAAGVFDAYANVDGGFVKTKIPMNSIFDAPPVSRSQAKRVCNRLEKFQEVIIDFDGISWMGQGFAHQIFAVFAHNHPKIKLTPVNMNEDVTKMYNHVIASNE